MNEKFSYLKEFLSPHPKFEGTNINWFYPVSEEEIVAAEKAAHISFPDQLREFYQEIGYGSLYAPYNAPKGYTAYMSNQILLPLVAAAFYKPLEGDTWVPDDGPIDAGDEGHYMDASSYEILEPGDLPFFEIADSTSFMVMKPHSANPNAVWYMGKEKIEDSFEKFIWNLYYESPVYWENKLSYTQSK